MKKVKNIGCAITAGGKATRMNGAIKAFVEIDGQRIIDRNIEILEKIFPRIQIITNQPEKFTKYSQHNISSDYFHDIGPLAGIHSALKHNELAATFIIASDLPFISLEIIQALLLKYQESEYEAIIPIIDNKTEPLFAIYSSGIFQKLESFIQKKESYAIRNFLKTINTHYLKIEDTEDNRKSFYNVNRIRDIV